MKKHLLIILSLFSLVIQGKAQEEDEIYFRDNTYWNTYWVNSFQNNSFNFKNVMALRGDTIFNGIKYKKLYNNGDYYGAIRESDRKVYAYDLRFPPNEDEILLYDFNLQEGDTFVSNAKEGELSEPLTVVKVEDFTLLNGEIRKKIHLLSGGIWIEGIGDTRGLLDQTFKHTTDGIVPYLVCFKQNEESLVQNREFCENYYGLDCCDSNLLGIIPNQDFVDDINILNYNNILTIRFLKESTCPKSVIILDINGSVIRKTMTDSNDISINLLGYNSSYFIIHIKYENKNISLKYMNY